METKLFTLRALARRLRHLGVTVVWLQAEVASGRVPALPVGRKLLLNEAAVLKSLEERAATGIAVDQLEGGEQ